MQAKSYARSSESEKQNNDRSIVAINTASDCAYQCELPNDSDYDLNLSAYLALYLVLGIVLLTNILLFILSLGYFHHAFNWLSQKEGVKGIYRSSAIVLIFLNCFTFFFGFSSSLLNFYKSQY